MITKLVSYDTEIYGYIEKKKIIPYVLYVLMPFVHSSMFLPVGVLAIFKLKRGKVSLKFLLATIIVTLFIDQLLTFISQNTSIELLRSITYTFNSYVKHNDKMYTFYGGIYLIMSILKMGFVLLMCFVGRKNKDIARSTTLTVLLSAVIMTLSISSIAMTRFTALIFFIALPVIMSNLAQNTQNSRHLSLLTWILGISFAAYNLYQIVPLIEMGGL